MTVPAAITATPRDPAIQRRCFESVWRTGFTDTVVCAEPGTHWPNGADHQLSCIMANERLGQWRNFLRTLECLLQRSDANRLCTLEDDVVFCRNVAGYLDSLPWPSEQCGCLHLYTSNFYGDFPDDYPPGCVSRLKLEHALDMMAACALVFTRAAAQTLVEWGREKGWRGHTRQIVAAPENKEGVDTFVGEVLVQTGYEIWIHNPSLVDHIGVESTLGHAGDFGVRSPLNFVGEDADARQLMEAFV